MPLAIARLDVVRPSGEQFLDGAALGLRDLAHALVLLVSDLEYVTHRIPPCAQAFARLSIPLALATIFTCPPPTHVPYPPRNAPSVSAHPHPVDSTRPIPEAMC